MEASINCRSRELKCQAGATMLSAPSLGDWPCLTMRFADDDLNDRVNIHFASVKQFKDFAERIANAAANLEVSQEAKP